MSFGGDLDLRHQSRHKQFANTFPHIQELLQTKSEIHIDYILNTYNLLVGICLHYPEAIKMHGGFLAIKIVLHHLIMYLKVLLKNNPHTEGIEDIEENYDKYETAESSEKEAEKEVICRDLSLLILFIGQRAGRRAFNI